MKIVIPGGSGQIGSLLARSFADRGHDVAILSRRGTLSHGRVIVWDGESVGVWAAEFEGADAIINLAGQSVNCRYHQRNRRRIIDSRVRSTRAIGEAISRAARPPRVWLQASTATIYSHRYDASNDEATGILGGTELRAPDTWRFSIDVAQSWERAALEFDVPRTRRVLLRTAMVMSPDRGGVFDVLLGLIRRGLGGRTGDGRQFMSWIADCDFVSAIEWLIEQDSLSGPVNIASPNPLPNADFMRDLRTAWGIRFGLPAPNWMLEIATFLMRTESELVLKSRRVVPSRLLQSGFQFQIPEWSAAARDLCRRWRELRARGKSATSCASFAETLPDSVRQQR